MSVDISFLTVTKINATLQHVHILTQDVSCFSDLPDIKRGFVHSQSFVFPELLIFVPYAHNDGRPVCIVMTEQEPVVPRRGTRIGRRRVQRQQLHGQIAMLKQSLLHHSCCCQNAVEGLWAVYEAFWMKSDSLDCIDQRSKPWTPYANPK